MSNASFSNVGRELAGFRKSWTLPVGWLLLFAFPVVLLYGAIRPGEPVWGPVLGIVALWGPGVLAVIDRATYRVTLFERGVRVKSLLGERSVALTTASRIFYKSVRESVNGIPAGTRMSLTIRDGTQRVHLRSSIKGIRELHAHMVQFEQEVILPARRRALLDGQQLDFGALRLRLGQLAAGSKRISPAEIASIEVRAGRLVVHKVGARVFTFAQAPLHEIPNMHTLFELLPLLSQERQVAEPVTS